MKRIVSHLDLLSAFSAIAFLMSCGGPPSKTHKAQVHLERGEYQAATEAADRTLAYHAKDARAWRVKIQAAMESGDPDRSVKLYKDWVQLHGRDDRDMYRSMAAITLRQGTRASSDDDRVRSLQVAGQFSLLKPSELREYLNDKSERVAAVSALLLFKEDSSAMAESIQYLGSKQDMVRVQAVNGLARSKDPQVRSRIVGALSDSNAKVRRAAVSVVASWQRGRDSTVLRGIALRDSDSRVRTGALRGLLKFGSGDGAAGADKAADMATVIEKASRDEYVGARLTSVSLLVKFGSDNVDQELMRWIDSEDLPVALHAAVALYKQAKTDMQPLLKRTQASSEWAARAAALNTVARITTKPIALSYAHRGSSDSHPAVRLAAARTLLYLGENETAFEVFHNSLSRDAFEPRMEAAADLAKHGDLEAIEALSQASHNGNPEQRKTAIFAHRHANVVTEGLIANLSDADISVRIAAAEVLLSHR